MKRAIHIIIYIIAAAVGAAAAVADRVNPAAIADVSFVNIYPGSEIYELEGHSALKIRVGARELAVSYGTFDFDAPNFVYRYVKGETDYWVTVVPWQQFVQPYVMQGRRIVEHQLDMDNIQKERLFRLLDENLRPENKVYRYNYVYDNCATRPLRIVERAMGDSIVLGPAAEGSDGQDETFRSIMRRYHANYPWYQFGIDLALGSGIDRSVNNREKSFAPVVLDTQLAGATVSGRRLVRQTRVINDVPAENAVLAPTPWYLTPLAVCWAFFVLVATVCVYDIKKKHCSRWLYGFVSLIYGLAGLLIWFLVFVSEHEATAPNLVMVWFNPLWLVTAVSVWIPRARLLSGYAFAMQAVAITLLMLCWHFATQCSNAAFWPLMFAGVSVSGTYLWINKDSLLQSLVKKVNRAERTK